MKTQIPIKSTILALMALFFMISLFMSCKETKLIQAKSGAQLWSENCQRCHNTPSPTSFSQEQWKTIGLHMQSRALLTNPERDKIVSFLQSAN